MPIVAVTLWLLVFTAVVTLILAGGDICRWLYTHYETWLIVRKQNKEQDQ